MTKEPLFHFLVFALLIFVYFWLFPSSEMSEYQSREIVIAQPQIQRLRENWMQSWRRPPSGEQLNKLIENAVREEIYYREGLILGLDKNDSVVRNRMVQKMRFLHSEEIPEPTQTDLLTMLKQNGSKYNSESLYSFQQVYLGQRYDTSAVSEIIKELDTASVKPNGVSKPLSVPITLVDASKDLIARKFGADFASTIATDSHPQSKWFGPIRSGFGLHLVSINKVQAGITASLDDAITHQRVENDWRAEQGELLEERVFERLRQDYTVQILKTE